MSARSRSSNQRRSVEAISAWRGTFISIQQAKGACHQSYEMIRNGIDHPDQIVASNQSANVLTPNWFKFKGCLHLLNPAHPQCLLSPPPQWPTGPVFSHLRSSTIASPARFPPADTKENKAAKRVGLYVLLGEQVNEVVQILCESRSPGRA